MRATLVLLVLLNMGMAGLYLIGFQLRHDLAALSAVGRDPISAHWRDATGTEFVVTKGIAGGETFDDQTAALAERLRSMQRVFKPAGGD